jgi:uncharacterized protein
MILLHVRRLGLAAMLVALAVPLGQAGEPSFDCAKASGTTEKLICDDGQLGALDGEMARLYGLARDGADMTEADKDTLTEAQRDWLATRDECGDAPDPRVCVQAAYLNRIAELRETYANVRGGDDKGISLGPFAVACDGMADDARLIFVNTDPSLAYLVWPDRSLVLTQTMSGSGARYAAKEDGGEVVFWNKGDQAQFQRPGHDDTTCNITKMN